MGPVQENQSTSINGAGHKRSPVASAGGGLDQPTVIRNRTRTSYLDDGCLNGSRGVVFPGSRPNRIVNKLPLVTHV